MEDHGQQSRRPYGDLHLELERCAGWLKAALEYAGGSHEWDDVVRLVEEGDVQFWPGKAAAILTDIVDQPRKRILNFWLAGGDIEELREMEKSICRWAKAVGCGGVTLHGRRGWDKTFLTREAGYEPHWWVLAKEL